jgi:hypothetical protein
MHTDFVTFCSCGTSAPQSNSVPGQQHAWEMTRLPLSFLHVPPFLPSTATGVWDPYVIIIFNLPPTNADGSTTTTTSAMLNCAALGRAPLPERGQARA